MRIESSFVIHGRDASVEVVDQRTGATVRLTPAHRRLVAALARGRTSRSLPELIDALWDGDAPASATASIHNHLSRLRERAPGLVVRHHDHYALGDGVALAEVDAAAVIEVDLTAPLAAFRERAEADPYDERGRAELIAALAAQGDHAAAAVEIERTRADLVSVGLEPSRRLADLSRLVADGERRADRLAGSTERDADLGLSLGAFALDHVVDGARAWLREERTALLILAGPSGSGRSHALRSVRDLATATGFESVELHCASASSLPVLPLGSWAGRGPRVVIADDVHQATPATSRVIARLLRSGRSDVLKAVVTVDVDSAADVETHLVRHFDEQPVVTTIELGRWSASDRELLFDRLGITGDTRAEIAATLTSLEAAGLSNRGSLDAIRLATGDTADRKEFDRIVATRNVIGTVPGALDRAFVGAMLGTLDDDARRLVDLVSLSASPFLPGDLAAFVPDLRLKLRQRDVRRLLDVDDAAGRISTRDQVVDAVVFDDLSPRRLVELHTELAGAPYEREDPHLRSRRHAAHGAAADLSPVEAAASMSTLADAVAATGDRLTAADISLLAADVVLPVDPARYCELAERAGAELLSAGDPAGLESLSRALDIAIAHRLPSHAASAVKRYCELGPTSGAGTVDEHAADLLAAVEPLLTDDRDLARVLSASTMVHALSGDTERCVDLFERAVGHAEATGDDDVLAETLPFAFLSLAAPDQLDRRSAIAARLYELAGRTGRADTRWEAIHLDLSNQLQLGEPRLRSTLEELRVATAEVDGAQHDWEMTYLAAVVAHVDGHLDDALRLAEASLGIGDSVGESRRMAVYGSVLLGCHLSAGSIVELGPMLEQMVADQPLLAAWNAPLALVHAAAGRRDDAIVRLRQLATPGAIEPDCTMSAVGTVAGNAVAHLGEPSGSDVQELAARFIELLAPWSGRWSWTGAATYGPIDTTLARLHAVRGDHERAVAAAAAAAAQAAAMRAPDFSREAADVLADLAL